MDPSTQAGTDTQHTGGPQVARETVKVSVAYLPAPAPFRHVFRDETTIGTVRTDALTFFGVRDHQDRDKHEFFLEFEGRRLTDLGETLEQLLGPHRREAHFNLIQEITKGARDK